MSIKRTDTTWSKKCPVWETRTYRCITILQIYYLFEVSEYQRLFGM